MMSTEPLVNAETESPLGVSFPHYFSTYCMHRHHESCRRTCKICEAECRCPCHWSNTSKYPEAEQSDGQEATDG